MNVGDHQRALLQTALDCAVPLWILRMQDQTWDYIQERATNCSKVIAEKGDLILFRSTKKGETAEAFNCLAEGIACLAFCPGGVDLFGRHWEAKYDHT